MKDTRFHKNVRIVTFIYFFFLLRRSLRPIDRVRLLTRAGNFRRNSALDVHFFALTNVEGTCFFSLRITRYISRDQRNILPLIGNLCETVIYYSYSIFSFNIYTYKFQNFFKIEAEFFNI